MTMEYIVMLVSVKRRRSFLKALASFGDLRTRRERAHWIDVEAAALVRVFGHGAYAEARKKVREAGDLSAIRYWDAVKNVVAGGTGITKTICGLCETIPPIEFMGRMRRPPI